MVIRWSIVWRPGYPFTGCWLCAWRELVYVYAISWNPLNCSMKLVCYSGSQKAEVTRWNLDLMTRESRICAFKWFMPAISHTLVIFLLQAGCCVCIPPVLFSSVQLLSCVRLFATPWIAARQASLRRRQWNPTLVLLPGKSHGRRSLVGCSPWGR